MLPSSLPMVAALSTVLSQPIESSLNLPIASSGPGSLLSNATLSSFAQNLSVVPAVHCDGAIYKRDLRTASCLDALLTIPTDNDPLTFGTRGSGIFDVPLPHRWISGEILACEMLVQNQQFKT